jgi:hypothetical protein
VNARSIFYALALFLAAALIFCFGALCAIGFLVAGDCGPAYSYYGCMTR